MTLFPWPRMRVSVHLFVKVSIGGEKAREASDNKGHMMDTSMRGTDGGWEEVSFRKGRSLLVWSQLKGSKGTNRKHGSSTAVSM